MTNTNRQPPLTRPLEQLARQELVEVIVDVLQALYLDCGATGRFVWNPDIQWDVTTIDEVAAVFRNRGLLLEPDTKPESASMPPAEVDPAQVELTNLPSHHPQLVLTVEGGVLISASFDHPIDVFLLDYDWAEENGGEVHAVRVPVEPLSELSDEAKAVVALAREAS